MKAARDENIKPQLSSGTDDTLLVRGPTAIPNAWVAKSDVTHDRDSLLLFVNRKVFVGYWFFVALMHIGDAWFLINVTRLYCWLLNGQASTANLLAILSTTMNYHALDYLKWLFAVIAVLHLVVVVDMLYISLATRRVLFSSSLLRTIKLLARLAVICARRLAQGLSRVRPIQVTTQQPSMAPSLTRFPTSSFTGVLAFVQAKFFRPLAVFASAEYFDHRFLVQECIEAACQIYQASQIGTLIATRWINHLAVGMIFFNCISTPFVYWAVPKTNQPLRRVLSVTASTFLNVVNSLVIPVVIFMPYANAYDVHSESFPVQLYWDDVWFVQAVRENQQVLITSYLDLVTTLFPHIGLLSCLAVCEQTLRPRSEPVQTISRVAVVSTNSKPSASRSKPFNAHQHATTSRRIEFIVHSMLCISGFVVFGIHIASQSVQELQGCKLHATPWFQPKSSCVVMNVNCYRRDIQGDYQEIDAILTQINSDTLFTLLFTHCPKLQIPTSIQNLHQFEQMEIYNSTIDQWPVNASLRQQDHLRPCILTITRTNMTEIPPGLVDTNASSPVSQLILYESNVTWFPAETSALWSDMIALWVIKCPLMQIPPVDSIPQLVLVDDAIESIEFDFFGCFHTQMIELSGSPLRSLVNETQATLDAVSYLGLEFTQLHQVPTYLQRWYLDHANGQVMHSLFGSPYCSVEIANDDQAQKLYQSQVCAQELGVASHLFPIDQIVPQRLP